MTKRPSKKSCDAAKATHADVRTPPHADSGVRPIMRDWLVGILVTFVVFGCQLLIDLHPFGDGLRSASYRVIQNYLTFDKLPVVIIDISDLQDKPEESDASPAIPPRRDLQAIIDAVASHRPSAIGVDVDFSSRDSSFVSRFDPQFFRHCLDLKARKGVPVFLGIRNSEVRDPEDWLGSPEFRDLAAAIIVPKDTRNVWTAITTTGGSGAEAGTTTTGRTLCAALANAVGSAKGWVPEWFYWLLRPGDDQMLARQDSIDVAISDTPVDYSPLRAYLKPDLNYIMKTTKADRIEEETTFFKNKTIVIIGDGTPRSRKDLFKVDGWPDLVPGVCIHACATYTLTTARLYELTPVGRTVIDFGLAMLIMVSVVVTRLHYRKKGSKQVAVERLHRFVTLLVVLMIVLCVVSVKWMRVLWDDFIIVTVALVVHRSVERYMMAAWRFLKEAVPRVFQALLFQK